MLGSLNDISSLFPFLFSFSLLGAGYWKSEF